MTIICDLDGTLCNIQHRRHFVEKSPKDWKSFYDGMSLDTINKDVIELLDAFSAFRDILIVTGRPHDYYDVTKNWLLFNNVPFTEIFMRKSGDFRSDFIIKKEIFENEIKEAYQHTNDRFLVIDDRNSVVKMWRELGLVCWQVAEGDF